MATSKQTPHYAEHELPDHAARLPDAVLAGADAYQTKADIDAKAKRLKDWTPPAGHTTQLPDAIVELGDVLVVDESLPDHGIVEPPKPAKAAAKRAAAKVADDDEGDTSD